MNLIGAKVYYDGSHWIAIPHTERPYRRRKTVLTKDEDEKVEQFEKAFKKTGKGKKAKKKMKYCGIRRNKSLTIKAQI